MAKQVMEAGLTVGDPSHLFEWPWPRVVAVYLMPLIAPKAETRDLSDPAEFRRWRNEQRKRKGLPLIPE